MTRYLHRIYNSSTWFAVLLAVVVFAASAVSVQADTDDGWQMASAYGGPVTAWDCGYVNAQGECVGYMNQPTSFRWHCATWDDLQPGSPGYKWSYLTEGSIGIAHRTLPLGSWVIATLPTPSGDRVRLNLPVVDRGPYWPATWNWDLQWGTVLAAGWHGIAQPRHGHIDGPLFGRQMIQVEPAPWLPRYCPAQGYGRATWALLIAPHG